MHSALHYFCHLPDSGKHLNWSEPSYSQVADSTFLALLVTKSSIPSGSRTRNTAKSTPTLTRRLARSWPPDSTSWSGASWDLLLVVQAQEGHHWACALSYLFQPCTSRKHAPLSPCLTLHGSASGSTITSHFTTNAWNKDEEPEISLSTWGDLLSAQWAQGLLLGLEGRARWESSWDNHTPWLPTVLEALRRLGIQVSRQK